MVRAPALSTDVFSFQTVSGSNPMQLFHIVSFFLLYIVSFFLIVYPYIVGLTFSSFLFIFKYYYYYYYYYFQFNISFKIISLIETSQSIGGAKREYPGKTT